MNDPETNSDEIKGGPAGHPSRPEGADAISGRDRHAKKMLKIFIVGTTVSLTLIGQRARAANDDALVRILTRADIVDNFAVYCTQFDSSFLNSTKGVTGDAQAFAQHVKNEVIMDLPQEEASKIVFQAANAARAGALLAIRGLYGPDPEQARSHLSDWCARVVKPSVQQFVSDHDDRHDQFKKAIEDAKR